MPKDNISIQVTQTDIDKAIVKDSSRCVVATAIARAIPDAKRISVDVQAIRFSSGGKRHTYLTPPTVAGYVVAFDAKDPIHPFRFTLRSDQHILTRTAKPPKTTAGKAGDAARQSVVNAKAAVKRAETKAARLKADNAPPAQVKRAAAEVEAKRDTVAEREAARQSVMAAYADQPKYEPTDTSLRPAIPKVFKRKERQYGMRQLRINQHTDEI